MSPNNKQLDLKQISEALTVCITQVLEGMSSLTFSQDPDFAQKDIIEYESRFRTSGLSKFNGPCFVTAINYYTSDQAKQQHDTIGALVFYLEYDGAAKILKGLGIKDFIEDDEDNVLDKCGELCKIIAEKFKGEAKKLGYQNLVLSDPLKGKNEINEGIEFDFNEDKYIQGNFYISKQKAFAIDVTLAPA